MASFEVVQRQFAQGRRHTIMLLHSQEEQGKSDSPNQTGR